MKRTVTHGYMALTTVLVLSAVSLFLALTTTTTAISGLHSYEALYAYDKARSGAESCAEYALLRLQEMLDYEGDESILIDGTTCSIQPIGGDGNVNRTIDVESTVLGHVYRSSIIVGFISPNIEVSSWQAVSNF